MVTLRQGLRGGDRGRVALAGDAPAGAQAQEGDGGPPSVTGR
jgi:hypothetical protein